MTYCREGHTLVDNEGEVDWRRLPPGSFFELFVSAVTYYGIVDEYSTPTTTTLICRLYSDPARTILVTTPIPTGVPYLVPVSVDYLHDAQDAELNPDSGMGTWRSPLITIRDDTGVWGGNWIAEPKTDGTVQFNFDGTHTLFKSSVEEPLAGEVAGAGLGAGTYVYCIVPVDAGGRLGGSSRTLTVVLAGAADILIDWLPNTQVTSWNVYGRAAGSFGLMANLPGATVSYLDNGVDVPNPAFQPPLLEDPAWTPAVVNREVDGVDGDITYDAEGTELGSTKLDDGTAVASFDAAIDVDITNSTLGTTYILSDVKSQNSTKMNVVLDPAMFTDVVGPIEDSSPIVIDYDYHVFINVAGQTVITEFNSFTGQTTTIIVNLVDNTFDITLSDGTGILATDSIPITANYTIPTVGSLSSKYTFSDFKVQPDGTILGTHTIEANTYQVTPVPTVGQMVVVDSDFFGAPHRVRYSNDGAATWINYDPTARLTIPGGFSLQRSDFFWASGEGWTVIGSVDNVTVSLVTDVALHWTNDITAVAWPFNDAGGRVAGGDIGAAAFARIQKNGTQMPGWDIRSVGALGPMMYQCGSVDNHQASLEEFVCFFPPSGVMSTIRFDSVGGVNLQAWAVWPEKNMLVGIEQGPTSNVHTWDFSASEVAPLTNHQQPANLPVKLDNNNPYKICCGADEIFVIYEQEVSSNIYVSRSSDGANWTHVINNNTNSWDRTVPGQEVLGMLPHSWAYNKTLGKYLHLDLFSKLYESTDGTTWTVANDLFTDHGGERADNDSWEPFEGGFGGTTDYPLMYDSNLDILCIPRYPGFTPTEWSGTWLRLEGAALDTEKVPFIGGASGGIIRVERGMMGGQIGASASPNGIPGANLRRYLGRSVVIPLDATVPPPPFVIEDPTGNAYNSSRTTERDVQFGNMKGTVTEGPGGLGTVAVLVIENGQEIILNVPNSSEAIAAARKPVPVNMQWSEV